MLNKAAFWVLVCVLIGAAAWYRIKADDEPQAPTPSKIAFVTGGSGDYWQAAAMGAREAADRLGLQIDVRMPQEAESIAEQMQILTALSSGDVDGIALSPLDAEGQTTVINALADGRPVVTFDSDAPMSSRLGYVGTSNFSAGLMAGTLVKEALPEGGKVAVVLANLTKDNMIERKDGFAERIAESPVPEESETDPRYEVVGYFVDNGDNEECAKVIRQTLEEHPDLACIVGMNARHGPVLLELLEAEDQLGKIKLVTFDTLDETLEGVERGWIYATVAQDPYKYGYEAVIMLDSLCREDKRYMPVVGRGAIHVSVEPIKQDKVEEFRERIRSRAAASEAGGEEATRA